MDWDEVAEEIVEGFLFGDDDIADFDFAASSTSSSSDSESEYQEKMKIKDFVEVTVPGYSDHQFKQHFRLSREVAYFLVGKLAESNTLPTHSFGRLKISPEKAMLLTLWYLANKETFRQVADRFGISDSSSHRVLIRTLDFLVSLRQTYIVWPDQERAEEISNGFQHKHNIRNILGAIDGSHLLIKRPGNDTDSYVNRKGQHSVIIQGVVDHEKKFIDVYVGEPGSLHDARVLKRSELYRRANEENLFGDYFLLGDSAYPGLPWLVPPFRDNGNLTANQRIFNYRHSSQRIIVEHAFGALKGRFRRIVLFDNVGIDIITKCIMAACVLHNICIMKDDALEEDLEQNNDAEVIPFRNNREILENFNRRNEIFNMMFNDN